MTHWKYLAAASLLAAPAIAQPVTETVDEKVTVNEDGEREVRKTVTRTVDQDGNVTEREGAIEREKAERMASDCPGRIFATQVEMTNNAGQKQSREIKLCGESNDPDKWIALLESAKEQVMRMDAMDATAKAALLDDLDAEIERTRGESDAADEGV